MLKGIKSLKYTARVNYFVLVNLCYRMTNMSMVVLLPLVTPSQQSAVQARRGADQQ